MAAISIESVSTSGSTLRCSVSYDGRLRRFLSGEPFVADYDVDLSAVPESVAVIPVLAHVCPVAWANGATVRVPRVDAEFLESLRAVGNELVEMYPSFMRGGRIEVGEAVENDPLVGPTGEGGAPATEGDRLETMEVRRDGSGRPGTATDAAMLFAGGVGSLATLTSRTSRPSPSTTHTLLSSNDTSIPAKYRTAVPPRCLGPTRSDPAVTITVRDSRRRANPGVAMHAVTGSRSRPRRPVLPKVARDRCGHFVVALVPDQQSAAIT
jgi:hypothetical protein